MAIKRGAPSVRQSGKAAPTTTDKGDAAVSKSGGPASVLYPLEVVGKVKREEKEGEREEEEGGEGEGCAERFLC